MILFHCLNTGTKDDAEHAGSCRIKSKYFRFTRRDCINQSDKSWRKIITSERYGTKEIRGRFSCDLHWIGGVPVDVRQAGTGGLPREGLHHS